MNATTAGTASGGASLAALIDGIAAARPDAVAIASLSRPPLAYAAFAAASRRVAEGLARQGIGPGDRVAIFTPNRPEVPVLLLALARLGAIAVPLDPRCGVDDLIALLCQARPSAVLTLWGASHAALPARLAAALPDARAPLRFVIGLDAGGVDRLHNLPVLPWKALDAMPERAADDATAASTCLAMPAGDGLLALHTQQGIGAHAAAVAARLSIEAGVSAVLPAFSFATPTGYAVAMAALLSGARLVCADDTSGTDALVRALGVTHLFLPAAEWPALAAQAARRPYPALGFVGSDTDAADPVVSLIWGNAETQGLFALRGEAGFTAIPPATLRLGETLEIQAPTLAETYRGGAGNLTPDGFMRSGLPATLAGDAFTFAATSAGAMLCLDGMPVAPEEVARFLRRQPGVAEAMVVPVSPTGPLVSFVCLAAAEDAAPPAPDEAILLAACETALAAPKQPLRIAIVEQLPDAASLTEAAMALLSAASPPVTSPDSGVTA
jgi:fatty-acyl-CoA synthase